MAEFNWSPNPRFGACVTCGTSSNDSGFVDLIGDTVVRDTPNGDIVGVVDMIICASCIHQIGKLVKMASPKEVDDLVHKSYEDDQENQKLKDEIQAWQQRFLDLGKFDKEDLAALNEMKEREIVATPSPSK